MSRHRSGFGGVRRSASYTLPARKSFQTTAPNFAFCDNSAPGRRHSRGSDAEGLAEAALAGAGDGDRARIGASLDPVEAEAAIGQRLAHRAADMQPPLAPV